MVSEVDVTLEEHARKDATETTTIRPVSQLLPEMTRTLQAKKS